jgi:hypothetical protein
MTTSLVVRVAGRSLLRFLPSLVNLFKAKMWHRAFDGEENRERIKLR